MPSIKTQIKPWIFCISNFVKSANLASDNCLLTINKLTPKDSEIEGVKNLAEFASYY